MLDGSPGHSLIQSRGLRRHFGDVVALDGLDLDIPPGVTGLVGANGAGKTTLIKLLLGLIPPTSGAASVFGAAVTDARHCARKQPRMAAAERALATGVKSDPRHGPTVIHSLDAVDDLLDPALWRDAGLGLAAQDQAGVLEALLPDVQDPAARRSPRRSPHRRNRTSCAACAAAPKPGHPPPSECPCWASALRSLALRWPASLTRSSEGAEYPRIGA